MPGETYFIASPGDYQKALRTGIKSIGLNYRIFGDGTLRRASTATISHGDILGISDCSMECVPEKYEALFDDILYEATDKKCSGILLDLQNTSNEMFPFISILSQFLYQHGIKHYVPLRFHSAAPYAELIAECAVSGGSLDNFYQYVCSRNIGRNISFMINPICMDFKMPSYSPEGKPISYGELGNLMQTYSPMVFFSGELVGKYFTYRQSDGDFHFVLFDDKSTIQEKMHFFHQKNDNPVFIMYSDCGIF